MCGQVPFQISVHVGRLLQSHILRAVNLRKRDITRKFGNELQMYKADT